MGLFGSTFQTTECYIWAKSEEKRFQNDPSKYFSTFQNLRLGAIKFANILPKTGVRVASNVRRDRYD
jgi:hypothetical protein